MEVPGRLVKQARKIFFGGQTVPGKHKRRFDQFKVCSPKRREESD